jgi:hypothetical protein
VVDERVGQPEMQHRDHDARGGKRLGDGAAGAAGHDVLLDGHERVVRAREREHEIDVERLDEAHVGDGRIQRLAGRARGRHRRAEREDRDALRAPLRLAHDRALPDRSVSSVGSTATPGPAPRG